MPENGKLPYLFSTSGQLNAEPKRRLLVCSVFNGYMSYWPIIPSLREIPSSVNYYFLNTASAAFPASAGLVGPFSLARFATGLPPPLVLTPGRK